MAGQPLAGRSVVVTRPAGQADTLCAALAAPGLAFVLGLAPYWVLSSSVMSLLLIWRHKDNIKRLLAGQESRIGGKKKET